MVIAGMLEKWRENFKTISQAISLIWKPVSWVEKRLFGQQRRKFGRFYAQLPQFPRVSQEKKTFATWVWLAIDILHLSDHLFLIICQN